MKREVTCWRLKNIKDLSPCCGTCHYDNEEFGAWMSWWETRNREYDVCCKVATWLESTFGVKHAM